MFSAVKKITDYTMYHTYHSTQQSGCYCLHCGIDTFKKHQNYKKIKDLNYLVANEVRRSRCNFRFDNISPCLTTKMGTGGNNVPYLVNQDRFFTLDECLLLQGFPKNFKLTNNYTEALKQIGNSVTINVVKKIVQKLS